MGRGFAFSIAWDGIPLAKCILDTKEREQTAYKEGGCPIGNQVRWRDVGKQKRRNDMVVRLAENFSPMQCATTLAHFAESPKSDFPIEVYDASTGHTDVCQDAGDLIALAMQFVA